MVKQYIEFCIEHQKISRTDDFFVVDGTKNYLHARFTFCDDWQGEQPVAIFTSGDICKKMDVVDGECCVPWEVLQPGIRKFYVGCFAGSRITSNAARVDVNASAVGDPEESLPPTPDVYDEMLKASKEAVEVANSVREDADSGKFVGPPGEKGDKGEPGAVKFIVVTSLPQPGEEGAIYLLYNFQSPMNQYDEYIFQNGMWEKIGVANVSVNLDEYVKKTDYAGNGFPGVVKVSNFVSGLQIDDAGNLSTSPATEYAIDTRQTTRAITPTTIDYAVKAVLSNCQVAWTEEEKAAARTLLGIIDGDEVLY